jgi:hypothetical protein
MRRRPAHDEQLGQCRQHLFTSASLQDYTALVEGGGSRFRGPCAHTFAMILAIAIISEIDIR